MPQLIPPPVTVPFPLTETVSVKPAVGGGVAPLNVAVTFLDWFIETVQVVAVPPQAPVQPRKVAPVAGVATSVTEAFGGEVRRADGCAEPAVDRAAAAADVRRSRPG